jgi:hypothetical protein
MNDYKHHLETSIDRNGSLNLPAIGGDTVVRLTRTPSGALYIELASTGTMMVASLSDGDALKLAEQLQQIAKSRHGAEQRLNHMSSDVYLDSLEYEDSALDEMEAQQ